MRRAVATMIGALAGAAIFLFAVGATDAQFKVVLLVFCAVVLVGVCALLARGLLGDD